MNANVDGPTPYTPEPGAVFCLAGDVPDGWECRKAVANVWGIAARFHHSVIVEARPIPDPPLMVAIPRDVAEAIRAVGWPSGSGPVVYNAICAALDAEAVKS